MSSIKMRDSVFQFQIEMAGWKITAWSASGSDFKLLTTSDKNIMAASDQRVSESFSFLFMGTLNELDGYF